MSDTVPRIAVTCTDDARTALCQAWDAGQWARGPQAEALSVALGRDFGRRNAVLTTNGFSALLAALLACSPRPTRVVTVAAATCFAMVNAILAAGAEPVFADLDYQTAGLPAGLSGDALIAPDHFGITAPANREKRRDGVVVIEDAAQAALSLRRRVSPATAMVLSFYPTKWLNGIDGGAVLVTDPAYHERLLRLVGYGSQTTFESSARLNIVMPDLHAAVARVSLAQADATAADLGAQFRMLRDALAAKGVPCLQPGFDDVPTRCVAVLPDAYTREEVASHLAHHGVGTGRELGWVCPADATDQFPVAARLMECTLSLPMFPGLSPQAQDVVLGAVAGL